VCLLGDQGKLGIKTTVGEEKEVGGEALEEYIGGREGAWEVCAQVKGLPT
jgi:hypothetical protein